MFFQSGIFAALLLCPLVLYIFGYLKTAFALFSSFFLIVTLCFFFKIGTFFPILLFGFFITCLQKFKNLNNF
ncbi:hypothetical protein CHAB381_0413 [Campylobacter hominis ATCC BAA-381]|uniref:Uncharacterized protein n=1 Tax=Campylobacter hominis (strain ATCC BAA-381 / DSM 21671 / CCUG 45161 / LMG 19568 / NCTC 13146 / CH001A) TaxID=360107 RepID=A7I0H1_CAMHC|nr:hypothetical protein CHAB381_0413 [Campylobacter hominis ATCC BAA-381]